MKKIMFFAVTILAINTLSSCTNTNAKSSNELTAVVISAPQQNIGDQFWGTYHIDATLPCGDTISAVLPSELRHRVCTGNTVTINDDGFGKPSVGEIVK